MTYEPPETEHPSDDSTVLPWMMMRSPWLACMAITSQP